MKLLYKFILIIALVIVLLTLFLSMAYVFERNFMEEEKAKLELQKEQGLIKEGEVIPVPHSYWFQIQKFTWRIISIFVPLLVLSMSIIYLLIDINGTRFLKSLLIPISYIIISFFSLGIANIFALKLSGEAQLIWLLILVVFGVTFLAVLIINLTIYLVKQYKINKR